MLHAGLVALRLGGRWRGALLRGPSGVGKSDLALRALAAGWRLVADDRVVVWASGGRAWGRAPEALRGLCEARGQGLLRFPALPFALIDLAADLAGPQAGPLERLPEPADAEIAGVAVPLIALRAADASAPARLRFALEASAVHAAKVRL